MNYEYNITIEHQDTDKEIDKVCNIAFQAGKDCMGYGFHEGGATEFGLYGKFSDMVRVYSALKNNGYKPIAKEVEEGDND